MLFSKLLFEVISVASILFEKQKNKNIMKHEINFFMAISSLNIFSNNKLHMPCPFFQRYLQHYYTINDAKDKVMCFFSHGFLL